MILSTHRLLQIAELADRAPHERVRSLIDALEACTTDEGPTQAELNNARAVLAAADEQMTVPPKRGGARKGAGRKPTHGTVMIQHVVSLDSASDAIALGLGDGNRSAGVRWALQVAGSHMGFPGIPSQPPQSREGA